MLECMDRFYEELGHHYRAMEELQRAMLECVNRFYQELGHCHRAMDEILSTFGIVQPQILFTSKETELHNIVANLVSIGESRVMGVTHTTTKHNMRPTRNQRPQPPLRAPA